MQRTTRSSVGSFWSSVTTLIGASDVTSSSLHSIQRMSATVDSSSFSRTTATPLSVSSTARRDTPQHSEAGALVRRSKDSRRHEFESAADSAELPIGRD